MKKLDIAIVGIGHIGSKHIDCAWDVGNVVAVCDVKPKQIMKYKCNRYGSLDSLLHSETPDLVAICTPNGLHAQQTIQALEAGCNVLCEKPMALTSLDCEDMIHAAEKANKRLFIVKQNRFNPPVMAVKKALDENRLGRIMGVQVNCFWSRTDEYYTQSDWHGTKLDGGVLFTQFSHFIDLLLWYLCDIKELSCYRGHYLHPFDDTGAISFKALNGAVGSLTFTINTHKKNMEGSITLFGTKGTVKIGGPYLNTLEYQSIENYEIKVPETSLTQNSYGANQGSASNHKAVYENVVAALTGNGPILADSLDGLKTIQFIERVYH